MKQTAVEWLESEMLKPNLSVKYILEKAKEMEKQQIIEAYKTSTSQFANEAEIINHKSAEKYYNETFKK